MYKIEILPDPVLIGDKPMYFWGVFKEAKKGKIYIYTTIGLIQLLKHLIRLPNITIHILCRKMTPVLPM